MAGNLLPLIAVGAAALILTGKKKKKVAKANGPTGCPPTVTIKHTDVKVTETVIPGNETQGLGGLVVKLPTVAYDESIRGNKDVLDIAKKILQPFIPVQCFGDPNVVVETTREDGASSKYSAPAFYFLMAATVLEDLQIIGKLTEEEAHIQKAHIITWWEMNMAGSPLPEE